MLRNACLSIFLAACAVLPFPVLTNADDEGLSFQVGFILSLTGRWAEYGEAQRNGLEMARAEDPAKFRNIRFIFEDCQGLGKEAVTAFQKLRTQDKVDLVFVWGVEPSLAVAPLADMHEVPTLVSGQLSAGAPERKFVVRTINYAEQYSEKLMEYIRAQGYKRIAMLKIENSFYDGRLNGMRKSLRPGEQIEVLHELQPAEAELRTFVTSVRDRVGEFDVLGVFLTPSQIISFFKEAKAQQLSVRTFGSTPFESKSLASLTDGGMVESFYDHNDTAPWFRQSYVQRFGKDDQIAWAANAYDAASLIAELFPAKTREMKSTEILKAVTRASTRQGAGGEFTVTYRPGIGYFFDYPVVVKKVGQSSFDVVHR